MSRQVHVVLVDGEGSLLGVLPDVEVVSPWWPDVEPVVAAVREKFGVDVYVLRLLQAPQGVPAGGEVTYSAELLEPAPAGLPVTPFGDRSALEFHPLRAPWAGPGGVRATIEWAQALLANAGRPVTGDPVQVKSWNLSSILRLPTAGADVWCKSVPPFLAHEGGVLTMVGQTHPWLVPHVLGLDRGAGTVLLADVAGDDQWDAPNHRLIEMVRHLVGLQVDYAGRTDELLGVGLPDWRGQAFCAGVQRLVGRSDVRAQLAESELQALEDLVSQLPEHLRALENCNLPDTLVHGDFHPGNWRYDGAWLVLLDWGDSGIGNPLLDMAAFLPRVAPVVRDRVRTAWSDLWREAVPASDPARAADLVGPVAALRQALIYSQFLDGIEPSEHHYHRDDVPRWLRAAIATGPGRV